MFKFPKKMKQERLTVSLSAELVNWIRTTAQQNNTSISAVVAYGVRNMRNQQVNQEMIAGLLEDERRESDG